MIGTDHQIAGQVRIAGRQSASSEALPKLNSNEILAGKVLQSNTQGMAVLLIKGKPMQVQSQIALTPGETITLQVKQLSPTPILRFLTTSPQPTQSINLAVILNALKDNVWKMALETLLQNEQAKPGVSELLTLMKETSQGLFRNPGADLLSLLASRNGLNLEAKLKKSILTNKGSQSDFGIQIDNDLKGLLLKALSHNSEGNKYLNQLLSTLKNIQLLNQETWAHHGKIYMLIPMQFSDGFISMGQLLLESQQWESNPKHGGSDQEDIHKATFQVDLSRLGPVKAEIMIRSKQVSADFQVVKQRARETINKQLESLSAILSSRGFVLKTMGCHIKDLETVAQPLVPEIISEDHSSICLVA